VNNCGTCGHVCPAPEPSAGVSFCNNQVCTIVCFSPNYATCDNGVTCTDLRLDDFNCGACGNRCPCDANGCQSCSDGRCGLP
jgi:hypothetical protein